MTRRRSRLDGLRRRSAAGKCLRCGGPLPTQRGAYCEACVSRPPNANPPGIVSRSHNVAAPPEVHERLASLAPRERGEALAQIASGAPAPRRAPKRPRPPENGDARLHVRLSPEAKRAALELAKAEGVTVGALIARLIRDAHPLTPDASSG